MQRNDQFGIFSQILRNGDHNFFFPDLFCLYFLTGVERGGGGGGEVFARRGGGGGGSRQSVGSNIAFSSFSWQFFFCLSVLFELDENSCCVHYVIVSHIKWQFQRSLFRWSIYFVSPDTIVSTPSIVCLIL